MISVFWVFPVAGSEMFAWVAVNSRIFVVLPRPLLNFFFVSPCVVSVG